MNSRVNTFHLGPQKSGTTWLFRAMKEHYQVATSESDSIHFFNMFYHKGEEWFHDKFSTFNRPVIFDPSPSYIRGDITAKRIYEYNADAKLMITVRNPLERAFSHYWHEKKKERFNFGFQEVFLNYDLYVNWLEPGFYAQQITRFLDYFPSESFKILFFDDLELDPKRFIRDVYNYCNIDSTFIPSVINSRVNAAGVKKSTEKKIREESVSKIPFFGRRFLRLKRLYRPDYIERFEDQSKEIKLKLLDVFISEIEELEKIAGRDLTKWKMY
ncbi:sulfotransferase domain-containing protein [Marinoscillum sp.]|uniref:sulfotransferase domain-containing protein n=1 Tax=Marinoscillum sp. TaxID=2024838 RepID=UPI003BABDC4D